MKYENTESMSVAEAEAAILRDDPMELSSVPLAVSMHSTDTDWAQGVCVRLASQPHFNVRGNAVLGFGHLARRFRRPDRQAELLTGDYTSLIRWFALADAAPEDT